MSSFSSGSLQTGTGAAALGQFGTISGIGGAASSAVGSYYSSQAQASALEFQAGVAESNARLAEKSAQSVLLQGRQEANRIQLNTAQLRGTQRAGLAANGVDLGEGSAARTLTQTEVMGKIDADNATANAVRAAWGYRTQATNYQNAALFSSAGAESHTATAAGFSSLLGSASSVSSNWYRQKKAGV